MSLFLSLVESFQFPNKLLLLGVLRGLKNSLFENGYCRGDPRVFEDYWIRKGEDGSTKFSGWQGMSYYADSKQFFFVQIELDNAIRLVHEVVGNAVTEGRHLVIGTGSTQLFQAALYALSALDLSLPKQVVSLAPYYSVT